MPTAEVPRVHCALLVARWGRREWCELVDGSKGSAAASLRRTALRGRLASRTSPAVRWKA